MPISSMRMASRSATARTSPGYNPDSYPKPGVPQGKLSEKHTITSKIYDGMKADYWYYASPGVDPNVPAPLMVWQDGQGLIAGDLSQLAPVYRHRKPGRAKADSAHGARADRAGLRARRQGHALHRIRHGERPLRPFSARRSAARSRESLQAAAGWLQPRHCRRIVRRHLLSERRLVHAGKVRARAFHHRQLHVHPVASRRKNSTAATCIRSWCASCRSATSASG